MFLDLFDLEVRPGDEVLPAWEEMRRAVLALRLVQGTGIRLTESELGTVISAEDGGASFSHPFTPALSGTGIYFSKGLVNGVEPVINGVPISGDAVKGQPLLALEVAQMDAVTLSSWACVEVTPKTDGSLDPKAPPVVVHRNTPVSNDPALGRHPLALVLWQNGAPARVFEVTYFNLRYYRTTPAPGQGLARHFFL